MPAVIVGYEAEITEQIEETVYTAYGQELFGVDEDGNTEQQAEQNGGE